MSRPVRVLHVLGSMNRGGVETWLMHLLRHVDRETIQMDLLVHTEEFAAYDADAKALGARIFHCPHTHSPIRYARNFLNIVRQFGPFDVLHSHVHCFSGYTLTLGRIAGIPLRIAHSHNDTSIPDSIGGSLRKAYQNAGRLLIGANCTHGLAVSKPASTSLFGSHCGTDDRFQVLYCGIDLTPFRHTNDRAQVRASFGFSENDVVFGHVGRFSPQKNHSFLIDTAAEIIKIDHRAKFLLVGDGPLRPIIEERARVLGLTNKIVFAGLRSDIPSLMVDAMDVFFFPSVHEGLPLVLMEAQAAGLRCLVSEGIPEDAIANPALIARLPLSVGAREWALTAWKIALQAPFDRYRALEILETSDFAISQSVHHLSEIYLDKRVQVLGG